MKKGFMEEQFVRLACVMMPQSTNVLKTKAVKSIICNKSMFLGDRNILKTRL